MVTAILKIVEMTLLKHLTQGEILPENNAFGDKYNVTGTYIILHVINCPFIFKTLITMNSLCCVNVTLKGHYLPNRKFVLPIKTIRYD